MTAAWVRIDEPGSAIHGKYAVRRENSKKFVTLHFTDRDRIVPAKTKNFVPVKDKEIPADIFAELNWLMED